MSEYLWAKIKIGGKISRPVLTHLREEFGVSSIFLEEAAGREAIHHLELEENEAHEGAFEALESYLMEQNISFDRLSDGGYESSPELRKFRPTLTDGHGSIVQPEVDRTFLRSHDNDPAVTVTDIEKAIAEARTGEELVAQLIALCGLGIPALPPLHTLESAG